MTDLKSRLRAFTGIFFIILLMGTFGFMGVENLSFVDALYFTIVTMATVGYGDIHPVGPQGKLLAIILIIGGVGTFLGVVANASEILINRREKRMRRQKLNVVIGLFFTEIGTRLLSKCSTFDPRLDRIRNHLIITSQWSETEFKESLSGIASHTCDVDVSKGDLNDLKSFLSRKGDSLYRMLENPLLLEHELFTSLLFSVFHLREELLSRHDLDHLPLSDLQHLAVDTKRVYGHLIRHWIEYMKYLKQEYPYLFSHAMRTNPFDPTASPIVGPAPPQASAPP